MTPEKTVEEVRKEYRKFTLEMARSVSENGDYSKVEGMIVDWWLVKLTQDRAALHTSLVAAVEGLEITSKPELKFINPHIKTWEDGYNFALEEVLTIINSIFKE